MTYECSQHTQQKSKNLVEEVMQAKQFDLDKLSEPKNKVEKITNDLFGSKMSSIEELKHKIAEIKNH